MMMYNTCNLMYNTELYHIEKINDNYNDKIIIILNTMYSKTQLFC